MSKRTELAICLKPRWLQRNEFSPLILLSQVVDLPPLLPARVGIAVQGRGAQCAEERDGSKTPTPAASSPTEMTREPAESRRNPRWQPSHIFSPYSDVIERQCRTLSVRFYYISQDALPKTTLLAGADGRAPD
ncbi:hypothetical protein AB1E18_005363 [Capra hircus]